MNRPAAICLATSLLVVFAPASSRAQDDAAIAEALFQQARALMERGDFDAACPRLEESLRRDRGIGALWHLARCREARGELASAWARYREVAAEARRSEQPAREKAALARARQLEARLSRVKIQVPAPVEGLVIRLDEAELGRAVWGSPLPVDPGEHTVEAAAPGHATWRDVIAVAGEGARVEVSVPALAALPEPVAAAPAQAPSTTAAFEGRRQRAAPWYRDGVGWALAGAGTALVAGGAVAFARAGGLEDDAGTAGDLDERDRLLDDAETWRAGGLGLGIAGGAALAAGIVKLALVPGPGEVGLAVSGRF